MRKRFLLMAIMFAFDLNNFGCESDLIQLDDGSPLSATFWRSLEAAAEETNRIQKLEAFYAKLTNAAEQAETELTFARIFGQRTGFVNPALAVKWYDKALLRNLPPTALARHFILRGNSHEQLKHPQEALADYIRGLLVCLQFNLPEQWPKWDGTGKLHPPPMNNGIGLNRVLKNPRF